MFFSQHKMMESSRTKEDENIKQNFIKDVETFLD